MSLLTHAIRRIVSPDYMLKSSQKLSDSYSGRDMYRAFVTIAWPALMESVLGGLISFVDTVMVSGCGEEAVAAVGLTNQPRLLFYALFLSASIAVNAMVSRRYGEKDRESANRCLAMIMPIIVLLGIVMTTLAFFVSEPLLLFAGAKEDTIDLAIPYFRITMIGMNFQAFSLVLNAAQRGCGNTRLSMTTNVCANVINVIFNALLINGLFFFPELGVVGAALATLLGNISAAVISFLSLCRRDRFLTFSPRDMLVWDVRQLKIMLNIASGSLVEQVFMRIGFFTYAKLVADLGTMEFATHQIVMSIINLSFTVGDGLGVAASALVGQNLGRKRPDHSLIYGKIGQRFGVCISVILIVLFVFAGGWLIALFSDDPEVIRVGRHLLYIVAVTAPFQISQVIFRGCLNGAGDTRYMAIVSFVSIAMIRPILTYLFCYPLGWGVYGAWFSLLVDQITRFTFAAIRFSGSSWYKKKI